MADSLEDNRRNLPLYLERLQEIAFNKDASPKDRVEAIEYLINRSLGSPKAQTDLRVSRVYHRTGEEYEDFCRHLDFVAKQEKELIEQYSSLKEGEGSTLL